MTTACKRLQYTGANRQVLLEFADAANDEGLCWPSRARMMYNTGLSEKSVKAAYAQLRKDQVIKHVGYAEYTDDEAPIRVHEKGGRGRFPIYRVQPEKGVKKLPFDEWLALQEKGGETTPLQENKGGKKVQEGGQNLPQEPSGNEPPVEEEGSVDKSPSPSPEDEKQEKPVPAGQYANRFLRDEIASYQQRGIRLLTPPDDEIAKVSKWFKTAVEKDECSVEDGELALRYMVARAAGQVAGQRKGGWCYFGTALDAVAAGWHPGNNVTPITAAKNGHDKQAAGAWAW